MDLFAPKVDDARLHPHYRKIRDEATPEDRKVLSDWAVDFVDRDKKFVKEFQTTFNSSFWELYLHACLKELGMSIDFSFDAPDFFVAKPQPLCIEATIASNADGQRPEWTQTIEDLERLQIKGIVDEATIRIANAIVSKYRKYQAGYSKLAHVGGKPFVVAIAAFEQPHGRFQNNHAINRVLYGIDGPIQFVKNDQPMPIVRVIQQMKTIRKTSGAEVPLGCFTDSRMAEISAVLFSTTATWGKVRAMSKDPNPYVIFKTLRYNNHGPEPLSEVKVKGEYYETLLDGLHIFHNPYAACPLPWSLFQRFGVTQSIYVPDEGLPYAESPHGALIQRTLVTLRPK